MWYGEEKREEILKGIADKTGIPYKVVLAFEDSLFISLRNRLPDGFSTVHLGSFISLKVRKIRDLKCFLQAAKNQVVTARNQVLNSDNTFSESYVRTCEKKAEFLESVINNRGYEKRVQRIEKARETKQLKAMAKNLKK